MNKIENTVRYVVAIFILIATIYMFGISNELNILEYFIVMFMNIILVYNELFLIDENKNKALICLDSIILILSFLLSMKHYDFIYYLYYILALFQVVRSTKIRYFSAMLILTNIMSIISVNKAEKDEAELWINALISLSILFVGTVIILLIAFVINQNKKVEEGKKMLLKENINKSYAYEQLRRAYDELENYTVLKERDRIAREMHDTVGHNLTIALVELENFSIDKVNEEDKNEFNFITERVRKSLYDIRTTVHKIKDNSNWLLEIDKFISNIKSQKIVTINYSRDDIKDIKEDVYKCIYSMIQEAITNGIKHGDADKFIIAIKEFEDDIVVRVLNNGKGTIAYKKGFGLNSMEERLKELNGRLEIESGKDEGFTLTAYIRKLDSHSLAE